MMIDFLAFLLGEITATPERKLAMKAAFAKQVRWTATITDLETGEEVDNPVTFKMAFNECTWQYIRQSCVAGQQKIRREQQAADDTFEDLLP